MATPAKTAANTYRVKVGTVVSGSGKKLQEVAAPGTVELAADDAARLIAIGLIEAVDPAAQAAADKIAAEKAAADKEAADKAAADAVALQAAADAQMAADKAAQAAADQAAADAAAAEAAAAAATATPNPPPAQ